MRCRICGKAKPTKVKKEEPKEQQLIKKKNPVAGKKTFAISQDRNNKKAKPAGQIESEKGLGCGVMKNGTCELTNIQYYSYQKNFMSSHTSIMSLYFSL